MLRWLGYSKRKKMQDSHAWKVGLGIERKERLWVILLMVNFLWLDLWLDRILFGRAARKYLTCYRKTINFVI